MRGAIDRALAVLFTDVCDVYGFEAAEDGGVTRHAAVLREKSVPCRVSYEKDATRREDYLMTAELTIKLFLPPSVRIAPGARVDVRGRSYACAGAPRTYDTHQEITLKAWERA